MRREKTEAEIQAMRDGNTRINLNDLTATLLPDTLQGNPTAEYLDDVLRCCFHLVPQNHLTISMRNGY